MSPRTTCVLLLAQAAASWSWAGPVTPADRSATGLDDATRRGSIVYQRYCANCHGVNADGQGRAAKLYDPKPANLQASRVNDAYKELIVRRGGAHVGRSEFMPPWDQELTDAETRDVIDYLGTILVK
jgi:mono/diheme cytochrome c family protein